MLELQGERFDRVRLDTIITAVVSRLRDDGYARAVRPTLTMRIDSVTSRVRVGLKFVPGQLVTVRAITVDVQGIGDQPTDHRLGDGPQAHRLATGRAFRAAEIVKAQRDLYRTEPFASCSSTR